MKWLTMVALVLSVPPMAPAAAAEVRQAVRDDWTRQFREINEQISKRGKPPARPAGAVLYGTTKDGDHIITAYYGFTGLKGGGLYVLRNFKSARPQIVPLLAHSVAENGCFQGRTWLDSTCYHLFRVQIDGSGLTQLTSGANNDLDPCPLPDGRIVFVSDHRGGMYRCGSQGNDVYPEKLLSLHSMKADGSDLFPITSGLAIRTAAIRDRRTATTRGRLEPMHG